MRRSALVVAFLCSPVAVAVVACDRGEARTKAKEPAPVPELSVPELAAQLGAHGARPVDANGTKLRQDVGVIPGAILLSDYETFTAQELPADRAEPLVFYCANVQCGASHEAARKAQFFGYTNVKVLPAGILGWSGSGQRVERVESL